MRKLLVIFFISAILSPIFSQWKRSGGPEGAAISSLANISGIIYAGTQTNGIYISSDDGLTWAARNAGIDTYEVTSIINFQSFIFAGTFGGGVYRSSDNGQTWVPPSSGQNLSVTSLVADGTFLYAGAGTLGLYRSSDNGDTWTQKLSAFGVAALCTSGNKLIASSSNYTFYSTDHGENWAYISSLDGAIIFTYYCEGDTIIAGGQTKIYRSTDNGNTFTTINLNFGFGIVNIYSIISAGSILYAGTSYDGVYKSTDVGTTWLPANSGMGPKDVRALAAAGSSILIAGTHYVGMYRSTDLGTFWNKSVNGFPPGCSILSLLQNGSNVFAGTRDGVFLSSDYGDSWLKMGGTNDTTMYSDVWAMCWFKGSLYASMQLYFNTSVYKSTDQGLNWIRCAGTGLPAGLSFIKGLVASGNNLIAGTDEGIFYSPDGGTNWYPTNISNINVASIAEGGGIVYAAVPSGFGVYRSTDNGVSWVLSLLSTVDYVEVAAKENYAFAGSFFSGARFSTNYGSTWAVSGGFPPDASVFAYGTGVNGMVLAGTDLAPDWIYVSFDNGASFSPYSEGLFVNASVEAFAANVTYTFAGTDYNGVWRRFLPGVPVEFTSFNASVRDNSVELSWQTATEKNNKGFEINRSNIADANGWKIIGFVEGSGTSNEIKEYSYLDKNPEPGTYNYRLKQLDFDGSFKYSEAVEAEVNHLREFVLYQNYPNPFNPSTTIRYSVPVAGRVTLEIFDILGEKVATLVNRFQETGIHEVIFDALLLPGGTYIYKFIAGNYFETKKMILIK